MVPPYEVKDNRSVLLNLNNTWLKNTPHRVLFRRRGKKINDPPTLAGVTHGIHLVEKSPTLRLAYRLKGI
jgi:hypothetical protein